MARSNAQPTPAAGNPRRQRLAHDHHLAVRLGELLAVVAADQRETRLRLGQDRQLHEIRLVHRAVEQAERRGIDHVLGIVQHDQPESRPQRRSSSSSAA